MIASEILLTASSNPTMQKKCTITFFVKILNIDYIVNIAYLAHNESPRTEKAYIFFDSDMQCLQA